MKKNDCKLNAKRITIDMQEGGKNTGMTIYTRKNEEEEKKKKKQNRNR